MKDKTGIVAYTEKELMAWSRILAMNELIYFIEVERLDDMNIYLLYIDKIDDARLESLTKQYEIPFISMINL